MHRIDMVNASFTHRVAMVNASFTRHLDSLTNRVDRINDSVALSVQKGTKELKDKISLND